MMLDETNCFTVFVGMLFAQGSRSSASVPPQRLPHHTWLALDRPAAQQFGFMSSARVRGAPARAQSSPDRRPKATLLH